MLWRGNPCCIFLVIPFFFLSRLSDIPHDSCPMKQAAIFSQTLRLTFFLIPPHCTPSLSLSLPLVLYLLITSSLFCLLFRLSFTLTAGVLEFLCTHCYSNPISIPSLVISLSYFSPLLPYFSVLMYFSWCLYSRFSLLFSLLSKWCNSLFWTRFCLCPRVSVTL